MNRYIPRTLTKSLKSASRAFYVILLTGPRQTGKTTLLQNLREKNRSYISLDDISVRLAAQEDPAGFIERLKLPVLLDEAQYAPQLFPYIKMTSDKLQTPGLFWLTGSQQFSLMKGVSESLAGRVAVFKLQGLSLSEEEGRPAAPPFFPVSSVLKERRKIDLLLEREGRLHPMEIKKTLSPKNIKIKAFSHILKSVKAPAGPGGLLYPGSAWLPLQPGADAVPICFI